MVLEIDDLLKPAVIVKPFVVFGLPPVTLYKGSMLTQSAIPSMQLEETLFWKSVVRDPMNVCKYFIFI